MDKRNGSTSGWRTAKFGNDYSWSNDYTEYGLGRSQPILQNQIDNSEIKASRGPNKISHSASETIGGMDITLSSIANCDKYDVEVRSCQINRRSSISHSGQH